MQFAYVISTCIATSLFSATAIAVETQSPANAALANRPAAQMQQHQQNQLQQRPRKLLEQRTGVTKSNLITRQVGNKTVISGTVINHGNVNTTGDELAKAAGASIDVADQDNVQVNAVLIQHGNVSATASNDDNATAEAVGTQVNIQGARNATVNVDSIVHGNITAKATGHQTVEATAVGTQVNTDAEHKNIQINARSGAAITAISQGR